VTNTTEVNLDKSERLLWTILRSFEALALKQYEANAESVITPEKRELVNLLVSRVPSDEALEQSDLASPVSNIITSATSDQEFGTLFIQGLLLEQLGHTLYQMLSEHESISPQTRSLCSLGLRASEETATNTSRLLREKFSDGDQLFQAFMFSSRTILRSLVSLGESLDRHFSEPFGIEFVDLMGVFASDLIIRCVELGMERRKIVSYLTGALMGS
jgi:hypothetical protein